MIRPLLLALALAAGVSATAVPAEARVGPATAQRIVDWRTHNGRFASVDQLRQIGGIGAAKYDHLKDLVTV